jgi:hypothetical protein
MTLSQAGWSLVDRAWSLEGDHSYLDYSLMWGGTEYSGVDAQYYQHPLQNAYDIIFSWDSHTLASGTVLWDVQRTNNTAATGFGSTSQPLNVLAWHLLPVITTLMALAMFVPFLLARQWRKTKNPHQ